MAEAEVDQITQKQRAVEAPVGNLGIESPQDVVDNNVKCSPAVPGRRRAMSGSCIGEVYLGELEAKAHTRSYLRGR